MEQIRKDLGHIRMECVLFILKANSFAILTEIETRHITVRIKAVSTVSEIIFQKYLYNKDIIWLRKSYSIERIPWG